MYNETIETLDITVEATSIGHDLTWGTSAYTRAQRPAPEPRAGAAA